MKRNKTEEVLEHLYLEAVRNTGSIRRFMSGSGKKTEEVLDDLCLQAERTRGSIRRFMSGSGTKQRKY